MLTAAELLKIGRKLQNSDDKAEWAKSHGDDLVDSLATLLEVNQLLVQAATAGSSLISDLSVVMTKSMSESITRTDVMAATKAGGTEIVVWMAKANAVMNNQDPEAAAAEIRSEMSNTHALKTVEELVELKRRIKRKADAARKKGQRSRGPLIFKPRKG